MLKRFCDICEREVEVEHLDAGQYSMRLGLNDYDLCEECFKDVKRYISDIHAERVRATRSSTAFAVQYPPKRGESNEV